MVDDRVQDAPLPPARALPPRAQWRLVAMVAAALLLLALLFVGVSHLLHPKPVPPAPLPAGAFRPTAAQLKGLSIHAVTPGAVAQLVRATGEIVANGDTATPVSLPVTGRITRVLVEPGQRVKAGQPLFEIASADIEEAHNALATARAGEESAAEALRVAREDAARQKAIYETAGGAFKDMRATQQALAAATAAYDSARSARHTAEDNLAILGSSSGRVQGGLPTTIFRAPVGGLVASRNIAPGQLVTAGSATPLLTITNPAKVWLVAQLPEHQADSVQVGDAATVTVASLPGRTFHARIDNVGAAVDPVTRRLPVRATIANPDGALKPQMFATFAIARQEVSPEAILVPAAAVIHEGEGARVWVEKPGGLLYARAVETGGSEGGFTRITRGLKSGERVVTAGAIFVNEAGLDQ